MALARVAIDLPQHSRGNRFSQRPMTRIISTPPNFPDHTRSGMNHYYYRVTYRIYGNYFDSPHVIKHLVSFLPTEGFWDQFVDNVVLELKKDLNHEAAAMNESRLHTASLEYLSVSVHWHMGSFGWPCSPITHTNWSQMMAIVKERGFIDILVMDMQLLHGFASAI